MAGEQSREELCRALGFHTLVDLHQAVQAGARQSPSTLLMKKLNAANLTRLGYSAPALVKLGYKPDDLRILGFNSVAGGAQSITNAPATGGPKPAVPSTADGNGPGGAGKPDIRALVNQGSLAVDLKRRGFKAHHCKVAGLSARELYRLGFTLDDLMEAFSPAEIRAAGFNVREMSRFFSGAQLRAIGFTAPEMKIAGYSVRDLINFGFNENHIIAAGYSINELVREGLTVRTVDRQKFGH